MIGRIHGKLARKAPAADRRGRAGRRLRDRRADEHVLPAAGDRRGGVALHPPGRARGRAPALRLRHRAGAPRVPPAAEDLRRRRAHRALGALGAFGRRPARRGQRARTAAGSRRSPASARRPPSACCWSCATSSTPWSAASAAAQGDGQAGDIINALLALGYNEREAAWAIKQLPAGLRGRRRHPAGAQASVEAVTSDR